MVTLAITVTSVIALTVTIPAGWDFLARRPSLTILIPIYRNNMRGSRLFLPLPEQPVKKLPGPPPDIP